MYDDWEIWEQIRQGDTQALKMLHNRYFSQMNLYARKIAGDHYPTEEIVSDCFIKLWTRRKAILIERSVKNYLFLMVRNGLIDDLRKKKVKRVSPETIPELPDGERLEEFDFYDKLHQALEKLPAQRRCILEMAAFDSFTYAQIAEQLHISVNTVKTQMGRAYRFLKEELDPKTFQLFLLFRKF